MTISYSGSPFRLLFRWKGSIWKSCWMELCVFLCLYYLMRLTYTDLLPWLDPDGKEGKYRKKFEQLALMFDEFIKQMPLTFLLGFYVSAIVSRWWVKFDNVAFPDDLLSVTCLLIPGDDEKSRKRRHTIARYLNLTAILVWRDISTKVRARFPSIKHVISSGLLTEDEHTLMQQLEDPGPPKTDNVRWLTPLHWAQLIMHDEIVDNKPLPSLVSQFVGEMKQYRMAFRKLYCYDWVNIPLVYTQVAALATYSYFFFCLFGRQFLDPAKKYRYYEIDFVVPLFTIVQFLFFVGWFKIGQDLMRPFGTDDDDFEMNVFIDRNLRTSFMIVNGIQNQHPELVDDTFWHYQDKTVPPLADTKLSLKMPYHPPKLHSYIQLDGGVGVQATRETQDRQTKKKMKRFVYW